MKLKSQLTIPRRCWRNRSLSTDLHCFPALIPNYLRLLLRSESPQQEENCSRPSFLRHEVASLPDIRDEFLVFLVTRGPNIIVSGTKKSSLAAKKTDLRNVAINFVAKLIATWLLGSICRRVAVNFVCVAIIFDCQAVFFMFQAITFITIVIATCLKLIATSTKMIATNTEMTATGTNVIATNAKAITLGAKMTATRPE